jgi:DNA mismatch endonuclease (patch repair protein)
LRGHRAPERNKVRDIEVRDKLNVSGWRVGIVWECCLRTPSLASTVEQVIAWIEAGTENFETALVRPRIEAKSPQ